MATKLKKRFLALGTGSDELSSRGLPADFTPTNYTPTQVASEGNDKVSAHLNGIDLTLGSITVKSPNTLAAFDAAGALYSLPEWYTASDGTLGNYIIKSVVDNLGGNIKMHPNETELTSTINTNAWSFANNVLDLHFDRSSNDFDWDNGIVNLSLNTSMEGIGTVTNATAITSNFSLGVGNPGNTTNPNHLSLNTNIGTSYTIDHLSNIYNNLNIDPTATITNYVNMFATNITGDVGTSVDMFTQQMTGDVGNSFRSFYSQFDGDASGGVGGYEFNYTGTITGNSYNGVRLGFNGTAEGYTGFFSNTQGVINNQLEHVTLGNSADVGGNYFAINGGNSGDITGDFFAVNNYNSGLANSVRVVNFNNTGNLTQFFNGISLSNAGTNDQSLAFQYNDTSTTTNQKQGISINLAGSSPDINGLAINVSGATSTNRKRAATFEGGTLAQNAEFTTISSSPFLVDPINVLIPTVHIESGTPITGTDPLIWLMGGNLLAEDDLGVSVFGLGFAPFANVGQVAITAGKTVTTYSGNIVGFNVPDLGQGVGDLTNLYAFRAVGGFSAGGSINITNSYGFYVDPLSVSMSPTNAWGFYNDTGSENFVNKLAIGTTSKTVSGSNILEINGETVFEGGTSIKEGTNAAMGIATLVAGSVTVSNTRVTASSRFRLTAQEGGNLIGTIRQSARTVGTDFTITSTSATDTADILWEIVEAF